MSDNDERIFGFVALALWAIAIVGLNIWYRSQRRKMTLEERKRSDESLYEDISIW
jgi:hypothetical protein